MVKHFDHVTIVVRDVEAAKRFFSLLGFEHEQSVVISGDVFADYMGVPGIEADHMTMVLAGAVPRTEVQLLGYRAPAARPNPTIEQLNTVGYNHVCFAVEDLKGEVRRPAASVRASRRSRASPTRSISARRTWSGRTSRCA